MICLAVTYVIQAGYEAEAIEFLGKLTGYFDQQKAGWEDYMPFHEPEEEMEVLIPHERTAFQELEEESLTLEYQRKHLDEQRVLLDLERAELEQRLAELKLQYAFLDALSTHLDQREAALASDYEVVRMTGNRLSPRLARR